MVKPVTQTESDEGSLAVEMKAHVVDIDAAGRWARKWKCAAQLIVSGVFAMHDGTGTVKAIAVVGVQGEDFFLPAKRFYDGLEWAARCGVALCVLGDKAISVPLERVPLCFAKAVPYVGPMGLTVDAGAVFEIANGADNAG